MAKDPAFLFYPNDWIGGTMGMSFEEKGAYMEVLMMQFNRGHMTEDMIAQTIGQLWGRIQDKFIKDKDGLWYNERLQVEKVNRQSYVQSRFNNKTGKNQYSKKGGHMTYHMEDENINSILRYIEERSKTSISENEKENYMFLIVEMAKVFLEKNPDYFFEKETDYHACLQIAYNIATMKKWMKADVTNGKMKDALSSWKIIVEFVGEDEWFKSRSLSDLSTTKEWQRLVQKMNGVKKVPEKKMQY